MSTNIILKTKNISKNFGMTHALTDVSLNIRRGEITGLIGENGSGKSTLSSIISGVYSATSGHLEYKSQAYEPSNVVDARSNGISMITQEMGTLSGISVANNIFIGKEKEFTDKGIISNKKMNLQAAAELKKVGITDIDPAEITSKYSLEQRKMIEVVRAVYSDPDILILDETTTALSQSGRDVIYQLIKVFKKANKAVVFISHDLDEIMNHCDSLTVLRDGMFVSELAKKDFEEDKIKELMVGRKITGDYYRSDYDGSYGDEIVLKANNIYEKDVLENISLNLHKGEILGIGGLTDSGMHELGKIMFGIQKPLYGQVTLGDGSKINSSKQAIQNKIAYVSKNRDIESLILTASVQENIVLPSLDDLSKGFLISKKDENKLSEKQVEELSIKIHDVNQEVKELSGGNKQKVVFGKWLAKESEIFILDCPTRGIDIGVKAYMYQLMYRLKKEGKSIIMISEELPELIGMSDRIMILRNGRHTKTFERSDELDESMIIKEML